MTVLTRTAIKRRPWRGYDDPGLPVGMYFAQASVLGDASGGDMIIFFSFKGEAEPISGSFYNIEQFNVFDNNTSVHSGHMVAVNFEQVSETGAINRQWRFQLAQNANAFGALNRETYIPLPLFLGPVAPIRDLSADIEIGVDNVLNDTLFATIQGYIWESRSVQAEGGLRRPVDSLYGAGSSP